MFETNNTKTPAQLRADEILNSINAAEYALISGFKTIHDAIWNSSDITPDDVFAALGNKGGSVLEIGILTRQFITNTYTACGLPIPDLSSVTPDLETTVSAEGIVTVIHPEPTPDPVV